MEITNSFNKLKERLITPMGNLLLLSCTHRPANVESNLICGQFHWSVSNEVLATLIDLDIMSDITSI